jgi:hypothetical protein
LQTRYGIQPGRLVLRRERWTIAGAAREIGVTPAHLKQSLYGVIRPSEQVRRMLPTLLERPIEQLFTPEAIEHPPGEKVAVG